MDNKEVAQFSKLAEAWWDPEGEFKPLHRINSLRISYLRDRIARRFARDILTPCPLSGLKVMDIGCGGGLVCEPLARLGAEVTGIDAGERNIHIASQHAQQGGLPIHYRHASAEMLATEGAAFDVVLALEVVEHVADIDVFLTACAALVKPGGLLVLSTINRTPKSFALAIVGAEYVMRWLPRGTHDWQKFLKPSESALPLEAAGLRVTELCGMVFSPLRWTWELAPNDVSVNYLLVAEKE